MTDIAISVTIIMAELIYQYIDDRIIQFCVTNEELVDGVVNDAVGV